MSSSRLPTVYLGLDLGSWGIKVTVYSQLTRSFERFALNYPSDIGLENIIQFDPKRNNYVFGHYAVKSHFRRLNSTFVGVSHLGLSRPLDQLPLKRFYFEDAYSTDHETVYCDLGQKNMTSMQLLTEILKNFLQTLLVQNAVFVCCVALPPSLLRFENKFNDALTKVFYPQCSKITFVSSGNATVNAFLYKYPQTHQQVVALVDIGFTSTVVTLFITTGKHASKISFEKELPLGARDIDAVLIEHLLQKYQNADASDAVILLQACQNARSQLRLGEGLLIEATGLSRGLPSSFNVSARRVECLMQPLIDQFSMFFSSCLEKFSYALNSVIPLGGTSSVPMLLDVIKTCFNTKLEQTLEPLRDTSLGACVVASPLAGFSVIAASSPAKVSESFSASTSIPTSITNREASETSNVQPPALVNNQVASVSQTSNAHSKIIIDLQIENRALKTQLETASIAIQEKEKVIVDQKVLLDRSNLQSHRQYTRGSLDHNRFAHEDGKVKSLELQVANLNTENQQLRSRIQQLNKTAADQAAKITALESQFSNSQVECTECINLKSQYSNLLEHKNQLEADYNSILHQSNQNDSNTDVNHNAPSTFPPGLHPNECSSGITQSEYPTSQIFQNETKTSQDLQSATTSSNNQFQTETPLINPTETELEAIKSQLEAAKSDYCKLQSDISQCRKQRDDLFTEIDHLNSRKQQVSSEVNALDKRTSSSQQLTRSRSASVRENRHATSSAIDETHNSLNLVVHLMKSESFLLNLNIATMIREGYFNSTNSFFSENKLSTLLNGVYSDLKLMKDVHSKPHYHTATGASFIVDGIKKMSTLRGQAFDSFKEALFGRCTEFIKFEALCFLMKEGSIMAISDCLAHIAQLSAPFMLFATRVLTSSKANSCTNEASRTVISLLLNGLKGFENFKGDQKTLPFIPEVMTRFCSIVQNLISQPTMDLSLILNQLHYNPALRVGELEVTIEFHSNLIEDLFNFEVNVVVKERKWRGWEVRRGSKQTSPMQTMRFSFDLSRYPNLIDTEVSITGMGITKNGYNRSGDCCSFLSEWCGTKNFQSGYLGKNHTIAVTISIPHPLAYPPSLVQSLRKVYSICHSK
ncbi:hypothetical protein RCL1_003175 [Eukaryota sp. TZLM3-RCL]